MFTRRCDNCNRRVKKAFEFCPSCGFDLKKKAEKEDYGFLGKEDLKDEFSNMPLGFRLLVKPLINELNKQMAELDKEIKKNNSKTGTNKNFSSFTIKINSLENGKPMKIVSYNNGIGPGMKLVKKTEDNKKPKVAMKLPKLTSEILSKIKNWPRVEPITEVRRLSDSVVYELSVPGVKKIEDVNIANFENVIEVKSVGDKEVFVKDIKVSYPLINYYVENEKLILEFGVG